jgi:intraflagellar transport protein 46
LKAFVPEYIPAIGEVDAFLKMPRPDGQPETLGLYVLVILKLLRINLL